MADRPKFIALQELRAEPDLMQPSWGSYYNDPLVHVQVTLSSHDAPHSGFATTGFRRVYDGDYIAKNSITKR